MTEAKPKPATNRIRIPDMTISGIPLVLVPVLLRYYVGPLALWSAEDLQKVSEIQTQKSNTGLATGPIKKRPAFPAPGILALYYLTKGMPV